MMTYYVCDGSLKDKILGAGIVKVDGKKVDTFNFYGKSEHGKGINCEEYALIKTLEMAVKNKENHVTIYNDHVSDYKSSSIKSVIHFLKQRGMKIVIQHPKYLNNQKFYEMAHNLSRKYLETTKKIENLEFLYKPFFFGDTAFLKSDAILFRALTVTKRKKKDFFGIKYAKSDDIFKINKLLLKEKYLKELSKKEGILVSDISIKNSQLFIFQRIGNKFWGLFNEKQELLMLDTELLSLSHLLLDKIELFGRDTLKINSHYFSCLEGVLNGGTIEPKKVEKLINRFDSFKIEAVDDFLFLNQKGGFK